MSQRPLGPSSYEKLLERAWKAVYAASEIANSELRYKQEHRLLQCAAVIVEIQSDVIETEAILRGRQTAFEQGITHMHLGRPGDTTGRC
jgi:hypothetical protein